MKHNSGMPIILMIFWSLDTFLLKIYWLNSLRVPNSIKDAQDDLEKNLFLTIFIISINLE